MKRRKNACEYGGHASHVEATARTEDLNWDRDCGGQCGEEKGGLGHIIGEVPFSAMVKILDFHCQRNQWRAGRK